MAGLIIPHEHGFAIKLTEKIEDVITILFLPLVYVSFIIFYLILIVFCFFWFEYTSRQTQLWNYCWNGSFNPSDSMYWQDCWCFFSCTIQQDSKPGSVGVGSTNEYQVTFFFLFLYS